ncbi:hypothetical protein N0V90_008457 [Kalmusia sp. IMI 367209]|nr:hypothetical protein N0V90_008457 [Kalmusia sp. IMI 367209]
MRSFRYVSFLIPFSSAWPAVTYPGYGTSSARLHEDLQREWYSKYTQDGEISTKQVPSDPAAVYSCAGPQPKTFPDKDQWLSFDELWEINEPVLTTANGGETYNDDLKTAILEVASSSKVDARLILAIIMQESTGKVSIHCTEETACGIMQHRDSPSFDSSNPKQSIKAMIETGIYGTSSIPGFLTYFNGDAADLPWVNTYLINGNPYAAAHVYNTGHIDTEDLSSDGGKSNYYAHDILSRLQGWNGWQAGCLKSKEYGIVTARAAKDNSSLLAIADSQLVILHDPNRGPDRKYALKSYEGKPRLLLFSPDSRTLYFTTTLSTSIQAYCIPTGELLPPPQIHPSPPSVLAISSDGNILLSTSSMLPTVCLQDLRIGGSASVSFQPTDARSAVAIASFQSDETTNSPSVSFLLGFQDGTLSLYRLALSTRRPSYQDAYLNQTQAFLLQPTRIGSIRKLHKAAMGGVTAADFVPGYQWRAVSIGHDGRCRLVDFEGGGKVLRT